MWVDFTRTRKKSHLLVSSTAKELALLQKILHPDWQVDIILVWVEHSLLSFYVYIKALERDKNICCEVTRVSKSMSLQLLHNEKGQIEIICLTRVQTSPIQCPESGSVISFCSAGAQVFEGEGICFYHCHDWGGTGRGGGAWRLLEKPWSSFSQYAVNPPTYSYLSGNRLPYEISLDGDATYKGCYNSKLLYQSRWFNFPLSYWTKPVSGSPCATNCWIYLGKYLWKYLNLLVKVLRKDIYSHAFYISDKT